MTFMFMHVEHVNVCIWNQISKKNHKLLKFSNLAKKMVHRSTCGYVVQLFIVYMHFRNRVNYDFFSIFVTISGKNVFASPDEP